VGAIYCLLFSISLDICLAGFGRGKVQKEPKTICKESFPWEVLDYEGKWLRQPYGKILNFRASSVETESCLKIWQKSISALSAGGREG
jgi:hypothetical protein